MWSLNVELDQYSNEKEVVKNECCDHTIFFNDLPNFQQEKIRYVRISLTEKLNLFFRLKNIKNCRCYVNSYGRLVQHGLFCFFIN